MKRLQIGSLLILKKQKISCRGSWIDALNDVDKIFKDFREKPEHKKDALSMRLRWHGLKRH